MLAHLKMTIKIFRSNDNKRKFCQFDDNARYAGKDAMLTDISGGLTRALGGPSLGGPPLSHWTNNVSKATIMPTIMSQEQCLSEAYKQ